MSKKSAAAAANDTQSKGSTRERSARKAMALTLVCAAVVLAGVLTTLFGLRYSIQDDGTWEVSGYQGFSQSLEVPDSRLGLPVTRLNHHIFFLGELKSIKLGKNITELEGYAFYGCTQLETVELNYGLESIGDMCFGECISLERLVIPSTVTYIHSSAFNSCDNLTIVAPAGSYAAQYAAQHGISWEDTTEAFAVSGS